MGLDVLGDVRRVDIDVDDRGVAGEAGQVAGDAIIEAGADGDEAVAVLDGVVRVGRPVHAEHPQGQVVRLVDGSEAQQRGRDGDLPLFGQGADRVRRAAEDRAAADVEDRLLRGVDDLGGPFDLALVALAPAGLVARQVHLHVRLAGGFVDRHVDRHVDEDRPGAARLGDVERFLDRPAEILDVLDEEVVLGDRAGDARHVGFLEGVVADQAAADLPGDGDHRDGVHVRRRDAGHEVCRPGARGRDAAADLAGAAGVSVGHVGGALFVSRQDELDRAVIEDVEEGQQDAARVAEEVLAPFGAERVVEDLGSGLVFQAAHGDGPSGLFAKAS